MDDLKDIEELFRRWREVSPVWPPVGHEEIMQLMEERMRRIVLSQPFNGFEFPWSPDQRSDSVTEINSSVKPFNPDDYLHLYQS
ncbi:hypothetical protein ACFL17_06570, partial [Pseudomonadota bacterium]